MFLYGNWLRLPITIRMKLAAVFGIPKTGSTHVSDNHIQSDGYQVEAVEKAITADNIRKYLMIPETDPDILWVKLIEAVGGRVDPVKPVRRRGIQVKRKYTKK